MNAPQIIVIVLYSMSVGIELVMHGTPKTGSHSAWVAIIDAALMIGLLKWGGFFA